MKPRAVTHRGSQLADGFWFPASPSAERQVLERWREGAEVRALRDGYLLVLREPRRVDAALGGAAPLRREGDCLTSAPRLKLPDGAHVALVSGGELTTVRMDQLERVDPATWLDVSGFELLRAEAPPPVAAPPPALSPPVDATALFDAKSGRTAEDKARQAELSRALGELAKASKPSSGLGLLQRLLGWLTRPSTSASSSAITRHAPPSPWRRLLSALGQWLASTRLGAYVGRKHAEYLNDLFELLNRHDDQEVLRRAIPLGGKGGEHLAGLPLLPPGPRTSFEISLGGATASSSLGLVADLYERLRRSYEAVFERLDAAGRHEQAAYFLAEILGESERAVAYLERRGQLLLAARLAEARSLPPGLVVRQWFLAGDRERAVLVATREGAFDDAITRLQKAGQRDEADSLRLLQAERVAQAGRFVMAAELLSGVERGRGLSLRFLALARAAGDLRGVALELSLDPDRFEAARDALSSLGGADDQQPLLLHLASAFTRLQPSCGQPLARELGRELLAEAARGGDAQCITVAQQLARYVGGAFKADLPPLVGFESRGGAGLRKYTYAATDGGAVPVLDLCRHGAHTLLALGETGAVLLNRHGKRVAHFDQPCEALVASPDGARVLSVGRRGERLLVGRIDLATRRAEPWSELSATSFCRQFDGETWLVQRAFELLQLDTLDAAPRVLRRVPLSLEVPLITLEGNQVNVVGGEPGGPVERLRYELPGLVLRQRGELVNFSRPVIHPEEEPKLLLACAAAARGAPNTFAAYERWQGEPPTLRHGTTLIALPDDLPHGAATLDVWHPYVALQLQTEGAVRILVFSNATGMRLDLVLEGASYATMRFDEGVLLVADDVGRILGFDPERGATPRFDWRA